LPGKRPGANNPRAVETQLRGVTPDIVIPDRYELAKSREKDNESALTWDEIKKADYKPWTSSFSTDAVVAAANQQVQNSTIFAGMKSKIEWISKQNDKDYPLNLEKYKTEQKELKSAYKQLDSLYKLAKDLSVKNVDLDSTKFALDKEKTEKNKQFLNRIKGDVYIDETVKVINNMITQSNLAVNNVNGSTDLKKN